MRVVFLLPALLLGGPAIAAPSQLVPALDRSPALQLNLPAAKALPNALDRSPTLKRDDKAVCRGRIDAVREAAGQAKLSSGDASSDDPMLIAAVDRIVGGCEVLVMRDNLSDIRPLPAPAGHARLRLAH